MRLIRTRDRVRALLAAGTVLGVGAVGTLAAWTDSSTATTGTFTTGTVDIRLGPTGDPNPYLFTSFEAGNLAPGGATQATLRVRNGGTLPFTYNFVGSATNSGTGNDQLGAALTLQVYAGACPATGAPTGPVLNTPARFASSLSTARTLARDAFEDLCFRATLPESANTALQGTSTVGTFVFTATNT